MNIDAHKEVKDEDHAKDDEVKDEDHAKDYEVKDDDYTDSSGACTASGASGAIGGQVESSDNQVDWDDGRDIGRYIDDEVKDDDDDDTDSCGACAASGASGAIGWEVDNDSYNQVDWDDWRDIGRYIEETVKRINRNLNRYKKK